MHNKNVTTQSIPDLLKTTKKLACSKRANKFFRWIHIWAREHYFRSVESDKKAPQAEVQALRP